MVTIWELGLNLKQQVLSETLPHLKKRQSLKCEYLKRFSKNTICV